MSARTPGEWKNQRFDQLPGWRKEVWANRRLVANLNARDGRGDLSSKLALAEVEANAEMIALAPKMEDVLRAIADHPADDDANTLSTHLLLARLVVEAAEKTNAQAMHTPGPWKLSLSAYPDWRREVWAKSVLVASCTIQTPERNDAALAEIEANAQLITSVPEMFIALQKIAATPVSDPKEALNSIQLLALAVLHKDTNLSSTKTAQEAKEWLGLTPTPRPEPTDAEQVKNRFQSATRGPWQREYIDRNKMGIVDPGAQFRVAILIDTSESDRQLIMAAPALRKSLAVAVEALEHLRQNAGSQANRDYVKRILTGANDPRILPENAQWTPRPVNDTTTRIYAPQDDLPIVTVVGATAPDLELILAAPDLMNRLEYATVVLEFIAEKAHSRIDREYAYGVLEGNRDPRVALAMAGSAAVARPAAGSKSLEM